jgi:hypothetical protein
MPKSLAGCHYNEEEFGRHFRKRYRILVGPNEWQQVCNWSNPGRTGINCGRGGFELVELNSPPTLLRTLVYLLSDICLIHEKLPRRNMKLDFFKLLLLLLLFTDSEFGYVDYLERKKKCDYF